MNESQLSLPQAQLAFEQGRYKEAVKILLALVEHSEHPGEAHLWLAMSWDAMGETRQAIDFLRSLNGIQDIQVREQKDRLLIVMEAPPLPRPDYSLPPISVQAEPLISSGAGSTTRSVLPPAHTESSGAVKPVPWVGGLIALSLVVLGFVLWWLLGK